METIDKNNFENICRTCLKEEPTMKELFSKDIHFPAFQDMIMSCTSVMIEENDGLPKKLCGSCAIQIPKFFTFKSQCESADARLRHILQNSYSEVDIKYEVEMELESDDINEEHYNDMTNMKIVNSVESEENIKKDYSFGKAKSTEVNTFLKKKTKSVSICAFGCRKCDLHFLSWNELEKHNFSHNKTHLPSKLSCRYCNKTFLHERNINPHITRMHSDLKRFQCGYCGKRWKDIQNLKLHLTKHSSMNNLICENPEKGCDFSSNASFNELINKKNHTISENSDHDLMCGLCDQNFIDTESLQSHLFQEHSVLTKKSMNVINPNEIKKIKYTCSICNKYFKTRTYLKRHEITHDPDKPYHCKFGRCPWSFASDHELAVHINVNHSEGVHECNFCHKEFKHARNLRQHMALHKLTKRFECEHCRKGFNYLHNLRNHERTHTGDLPYLCQECGQAFATKDRLAFHIKRHSNDRPFSCQICDKKYVSSGELNAHKKRIHTNERPFMCSVCGKTFRTRNYLTKHVKALHSNKQEDLANADLVNTQNQEHSILSCNICKFQAEARQELDKHMKNHTCQYFCPYCAKSFSLASALETHIKIHSDEDRSHVCSTCGIAFKRADHLRSHITRKHGTPTKPFKCSCCIRSFTVVSDLKKHSRTHERRKPYKCKECGRCFSQSGALRIHARIHTNERPYICGVCHCSHRTAGSLTSHMRTHTTSVTTHKSQKDKTKITEIKIIHSQQNVLADHLAVKSEESVIKVERNENAVVKNEIDPLGIGVFHKFPNLLPDNSVSDIVEKQLFSTKVDERDLVKNDNINVPIDEILI